VTAFSWTIAVRSVIDEYRRGLIPHSWLNTKHYFLQVTNHIRSPILTLAAEAEAPPSVMHIMALWWKKTGHSAQNLFCTAVQVTLQGGGISQDSIADFQDLTTQESGNFTKPVICLGHRHEASQQRLLDFQLAARARKA
jgi:hypothetical protein